MNIRKRSLAYTSWISVSTVVAIVVLANSISAATTIKLNPENRTASYDGTVAQTADSCQTRVVREFIWDLQFWENTDFGVWDMYWGTWWLDINCYLRLLMRPNTSGGVDLELEVRPYFVRAAYGDSVVTVDGVSEFGDLGIDSNGDKRLWVGYDLLIYSPWLYWDPPFVVTGGRSADFRLLGGITYGEWSIVIDFWNEGTDTWKSQTVHFNIPSPCDYDSTNGGYLIEGGLVTSRSEDSFDQPWKPIVSHPAGTVRYYVSDLTPQSTDVVDITQVYEMVKNTDSTYGSSYQYTPVNLLYTKLEGYGVESCWPADCSMLFDTAPVHRTTISVPASNITNSGCSVLQLTSEFVVAPVTTKSVGPSTIGLQYVANADTILASIGLDCTVGTVPGSADNFAVLDVPMVQTIQTADICVQPGTPVYITQFTPISRGEYVELAWQIAADEEIAGFDIYRRLDKASQSECINRGGTLDKTARSFIDPVSFAGSTIYYTLAVKLSDGREIRSPEKAVSVAGHNLQLLQNQPNPFNPSTTISFILPEKTHVTLSVYDVSGKHIKTITDEIFDIGFHKVDWIGEDERRNRVGSGVYFYRLETRKKSLTKKMILLK